jgi:tetratricopeptide (TPR) repeat protein
MFPVPSDPENDTSTGRPVTETQTADYDPELSAGARHHEAGRFREAEQLYRRVLQRDPNNADALNLLGVLAAQAGHARDAKDMLSKAVAIDGGNPEFRFNLGLVCQGTGDRDEAIKYYRQAVEIRPTYADAWLNLGGLLLNKGDAEEAERCHRQAVVLDPANPVAHHNLGAALLVRQAYQQAEQCFREALRLQPVYAEACNGLGLARSAQGSLDEAAAQFRRALALNPDYAEAHNSLGYTLLEQDRLEEAVAEMRAALAAKPEFLQARVNLAIIMVEQEDFEEALKIYDQVLQDQPGHAAALAGKAAVLDRQGRRDEAARIVMPFADAGSLPHAMISLYGRLSRDAGEQEKALAPLKNIQASGTAAENVQRDVHFALGDLYDDLGQYDRAFEHYAAGNALRHTDYDPQSTADRTDRIIAYFSTERLAALPRASMQAELSANVSADLPIFIVGTPRSGTSLVEQILSCHPEVQAAGELRHMMRLAEGLGLGFQGGDSGDGDANLDGERLTAAAESYLQALGARAGEARRVTDKMPYNFERLGLISLLFAGARVIHCRRDPLDSCLSCYFQNFSRGNFQTFDLRHLGLYHRHYERLMAHWRDVLDLPILDVSYEAHVEDPEGTLREILEFLELDWDPACLAFHDSKRFVKTASRDQVKKPIYKGSVGRWRNYEAHLTPLKDALGLEP